VRLQIFAVFFSLCSSAKAAWIRKTVEGEDIIFVSQATRRAVGGNEHMIDANGKSALHCLVFRLAETFLGYVTELGGAAALLERGVGHMNRKASIVFV
jgi:hypothetical protein